MTLPTDNSGSDWHCLDLPEVLRRLDTSPSGLSAAVARRRLAHYGPNSLPQPQRRSLLAMVRDQLTDYMILVLLVAAVVAGLIGALQDALAIGVIVLLNAVIGVAQEVRAQRALDDLRAAAAPDTRVLRDGRALRIPASELVPGDVVQLEAGNVVPADLRLLEATTLQVDESILTGESRPVEKHIAPLVESDLALGDRLNLAFMNSLVTRGSGAGVVVASATASQVGRIHDLLRTAANVKTPLQLRLARFGGYLALAVLAICIIVFFAGWLQGEPPLLMFLTAISLAVAAIPEALPAVVAISLALGARQLVLHNALVRNLPAVETLGSVTYICTDKTGTLTQNRMHVERYVAAGERLQNLTTAPAELGIAMALNNDVALTDGEPAGEPTELALFDAAHRAGFEKAELQRSFPRVGVIPFDSTRQQMTTLHATPTGTVAYVKGAPERVLAQCHSQLGPDGEQPLAQQQVLDEAESLANEGYRVLALARRELTAEPVTPAADAIEQQLTLLGLVALIDPPRNGAAQAVSDCHTAGIIPVMITGDHPGTAMAIARRLGIARDASSLLTSADLSALTDEQLQRQAVSARVYARVSPEQKLRIVQALQANGEFVAMTGDGVNDAPALQSAGIGVAMGRAGTDVARAAADMVLLDDDFATIVRAVRVGRRVFDNIRKFIKYTMSSNSGEVWTLLLAPLLGLPVPLLPIHILWINLVTDGLPGLAFAAEPAEPGIMERPPRPPRENLLAHGMWQYVLWTGLGIGALTIAAQAWALGRDVTYWQTMVFTVLTLSQLFHSLAVRSEHASLWRIGLFSNMPLLGAVVLALLLQLAVIYTPALNDIVHTQPLPLLDLLACVALSSLVLWAVEVSKWLRRNC